MPYVAIERKKLKKGRITGSAETPPHLPLPGDDRVVVAPAADSFCAQLLAAERFHQLRLGADGHVVLPELTVKSAPSEARRILMKDERTKRAKRIGWVSLVVDARSEERR